ncbi:MAG: hypothetical protein HQ483_16530 [Rhodospirillales bacterium]|nr:hypothetical protein [Rhodospirillales bacterium]
MLNKILLRWLTAVSLFAFASGPSMASGLPFLEVAVVLDPGASLFESLNENQRKAIISTLNDNLKNWVLKHIRKWQAVADLEAENRLIVSISDLDDLDSENMASLVLQIEMTAFGDVILEQTYFAMTKRPVTNVVSAATKFLGIDLELALGKHRELIKADLANAFAQIEDGLGTTTDLVYAISPLPSSYEYWPNRVRRVWKNGRSEVRKKVTGTQYVSDTAYFDHPGMVVSGTLFGVPKGSRIKSELLDGKKGTEFCVQRTGVETIAAARADLSCVLGKVCQLTSAQPTGWFRQCETEQTWLEYFKGFPVRSAHASETRNIWSAASLETLIERSRAGDNPKLGFTVFEIKSDGLDIDGVDGYSIALQSNAVPIWVDGIQPEKLIYPFKSGTSFNHQFSLETLNFSGKKNGCDTITAKITFVKEGLPIGKSVILRRPYAALRDAVRVPIDTFSWEGRYVHPQKDDEYQIFVDSASFARKDHARQKQVLDWLRRSQQAISALNWKIPPGAYGAEDTERQGLVVGVMRPPLQPVINDPGKFGYGISIGVKRPSGQVQMVFPKERTARRLALFLSDLAKKELDSLADQSPPGDAKARRAWNHKIWVLKNRLVPMGNPNVYVRRNRRADGVAPLKWVCTNETDLIAANQKF